MRASHLAVVLMVLGSSLLLPVSAQTNGSNIFNLPGTSPLGCWYWWTSYSLVGGQDVTLQWSTQSQIPIAVNLYITTPSAGAAKWYCDVGLEAYYYSTLGVFGSVNWRVPETGTYIVLVVNYDLYTTAGTLSLTAGNAAVPFLGSDYGIARLASCGRQC